MAIYINSNKPMTFRLNFNPSECTDLELTFKQGDVELVKDFAALEQPIADTVENDGRWWMPFAFTVEESNMFEAGEFIQMQFRLVLDGIQDYTNEGQLRLTDIL